MLVPLTLPIGDNRPNVYMGFGDSITAAGLERRRGLSPAAAGAPHRLLRTRPGRERRHLRHPEHRRPGADRRQPLPRASRLYAHPLRHERLQRQRCRLSEPADCYTIESLQNIILSARGSRSLPVLSTMIPGNPSNPDQQPQRNEWVAAVNERIKALARQERVPLADPDAAVPARGGSDSRSTSITFIPTTAATSTSPRPSSRPSRLPFPDLSPNLTAPCAV